MHNTFMYRDDDLVAVVWPRRSEPSVRSGEMTWEEAAREAWAMNPHKADRVRVLVAVFDDVVMGAWAVRGAAHQAMVPAGKSRSVSRSRFDTADDPRLDYLIGLPSPLVRRRNPQATFELRDLTGADALIGAAEPAAHGLVRLGEFTLTVFKNGSAELHVPAGAVLTVRTVS